MPAIVADNTKDWIGRIKAMYAEGASDAEVAASEGHTLRAFYKEINDNPKFAEFIEFGRTLSQAYWEKMARKNVDNKGFNTSLWTFYMKNKFGWADKVESSNTNEVVTNDIDALRAEISKSMLKFAKQYYPEMTDAQRVLTLQEVDVSE